MQFQKERNINFTLYLITIARNIIFLIFLFASNLTFGQDQEIPLSFIKISNNLIEKAPKTFTVIDSALILVKSDTILMRYFANESSKKNYLSGEAYALNQLGNAYRNFSLYAKAIQFHQLALDTSVTEDNLEFRIYSLNMLSLDFLKIEAIQSSINKVKEALELAEAVKNPSIQIKRSIGVSLNGLGNIYKNLGQYDIALEKFKESLTIAEKLGDTTATAINHQDIGECLEATSQIEEALENYQKSEIYNKKIGSDRLYLVAKLGIAHIYVHMGKNEEALEILSSILKKSQDLGDKDLNSKIELNLGWTMIDLNQFIEAKKHLLNGLEIAQNYNLPGEVEEAYTFLSQLAIQEEDYKNALLYYKKARAIENRISNDRNKRYVADLISSSENDKKNNQIQALTRKNELAQLKLRKNENTILVSVLLLALFLLILFILHRQSELKSEKKLLTLEQSMLRSQMNPHFLFNSLNSIKLYIINNEKKNAVYYLNKFSKLVRKILEASSLKEIPLSEELETIELYMNIENIRFSNEINFKINIEDGIDTEAIKIPSLILQPFLENAIWHGLSSKEGDKSIQIDINKENEYFTSISIMDNGIGRAASEVIKDNKVLKRKSIGIDITKERLANYSKDFQNNFEVKMIDLSDENNNPIGTKVVILIPSI